MKLFFRILRHIGILLFIKLPVQLIGIPIVAICLLVIDKDAGRLPNWAKYWDNGDELDRIYGLKGDIGYQQSMIEKGHDPDGFYSKFNWLALRNPANYFQHRVLGKSFLDLVSVDMFEKKTDYPSLEIGDWTAPGTRKIEATLKNGDKIWEYYIIKQYSFRKDKCFRFRCGWKIGGEPFKYYRPTIQWVCAIQPWKSYKGIGS